MDRNDCNAHYHVDLRTLFTPPSLLVAAVRCVCIYPLQQKHWTFYPRFNIDTMAFEP